MTENSNSLHEKLSEIQKDLKAPKNQKNTFGNYNYRSCEDILEAVKPLLIGLTLIIEDEIVNVGARYYVKATVSLSDGVGTIKSTAFAREAEDKKGMDDAQITGATSSYARKYALNGLFAIDDTKDADTMDNRTDTKKQAESVGHLESADDIEGATEAKVCSAHEEPVQMLRGVSKSKFDENGDPKTYWWHKGENGKMCFGSGYQS